MLHAPGNRLLMACILARRDTASGLRAVLSKDHDWTYISHVARQGGISPFLYHNLKELGMEGELPPHVRQEWTRIYHSAGLRNALLYEELGNVLRSFGKAGIPLIVLKGAALAAEVYGNVALRQMGDIDLLVKEQDLDRSAGELTSLGYVPNEGYSEEWYRLYHHHLVPYHHPAKGVTIEIHRSIVPSRNPSNLDINSLWERARHAKIRDVDALVLSPEDQILHLSMHMSGSDYFIGRVRTLIDISQVVGYFGKQIHWDRVVREAQAGGFAAFIYYPLYLASETLGVEIGKETLGELKRGSHTGRFEDRLLKRIIRGNVFPKDRSQSVFPVWFLRALCRELLTNAGLLRKTGSFLRTVLRETGSTDRMSPGAFPLLSGLSHTAGGLFKALLRLPRTASNLIFRLPPD